VLAKLTAATSVGSLALIPYAFPAIVLEAVARLVWVNLGRL
jgi:hypothetical protein